LSGVRGKLELAMETKFKLQNRRYIGSKLKLLDWIYENVQELTDGKSFFDVFAGTGVVSQRFLSTHKDVILNDFLYSNEVIYQAFFNSNGVNYSRLEDIAAELDPAAKSSTTQNYFDENFGGKFFSKRDARAIGQIRQQLEDDLTSNKISRSEFYVLLASLIYSTDKISNTVGHYDAYLKGKAIPDRFEFRLIQNLDTRQNDVKILRGDANEAAGQVIADIAFLDPPYNSRQYSRFYHVLENLAEWKKPRLFGTALKPEPQNMSDYSKTSAPKVFSDLVDTLNCKYVVVTYNNTFRSKSSSSKNKITLEEITEILNRKGSTTVLSTNHQYFNSGKTQFDDHREFLFITKVGT
jgi:adenine-specific DNA-methyltransferase